MNSHANHSQKALTALFGIIVAVALSACAGNESTTCSAVGYINTLTVQLTGDSSQIEEVRLCDLDGVCSHVDDGTEQAEASHTPLAAGIGPTTEPSSSLEHDLSPYSGNGGGSSWSFRMPTQPEKGTITADYSDGSVAAEATVDFVWKRVGDTAECGGPFEAGPVTLQLP